MRLEFHPLAELFPLIEGEDFDALVEDVREYGVRDPIVVHEGSVLDGRNRYRALIELSKTGELLGRGWGHRAGSNISDNELAPPHIWFVRYNATFEGDPLAWVISKNLKRRHLDESQRAMVAAKLANMGVGRPRKVSGPAPDHIPPIGGISAQATAAMLNVGTRSVDRASAVLRNGVAELQHAVEQGRVAVSTAEALTHMPAEQQAAIVAKGEKEILAKAKEIRLRDRRVRFDEMSDKLAAISEASKPLPTGQRFPIILADPATRYVSGFSNRSIENHYPTMTVEELCALPVNALATDSAVLFVWTTIPQLRNTMRFIEAWGFNYVSAWCWDKVDQGTGHWGFNSHEELLIATRGDFPAPVPGTQPRSLFSEKKTAHSAKPAWFAEQIERIWPRLPKIELFSRNPRPGWEVWGNQSGADESDDNEAA